jgi:eukaryotic-like serine/threonine-protein kinase
MRRMSLSARNLKVEGSLPNRYRGVAVPLRSAYRTRIERAIEGSGEIFEDFAADTWHEPLRGVVCIMDKTLIDERYELRTLAGSGGMADVYLAHDEVLDRPVALKLLKDHLAQNHEFVERFRHEARSAASLSHPHIVPVFAWGETGDGMYYIVMEYLPGGTLKDTITSKGALPDRTAAAVALQIAEGLQAAHEQGMIHRDIKPHNILVTDSGHVQVADFGIARAAEATTISDLGYILGSAQYMSPEQAAGETVGLASDLYSLGVVLYEMLTGRVPFEVEVPSDVLAKHADGPPRPRKINPEVPEGTDTVVMRLLATDPENRYGSADQLIEDLRRIRDGLPPLSLFTADEATTAALVTPAASTLLASAPGDTGLRRRRGGLSWTLAAFTLLALLSAVGAATGWNSLQDSGAASISEILTGAPGGPPVEVGTKSSEPEEVKVPGVENTTEQEAKERLTDAGLETAVWLRTSSQKDAGRVLEQSLTGGTTADKGSKVLLTVGEAPEAAKVPDLVGLSYPEAENSLEESGFLLGGVQEAHSETVPAGMIMKQDPTPGTTLEPNSYVYLTTSVGPPEESNAAQRTKPQSDSSPAPTATPTTSPSASRVPSDAGVPAVGGENEFPNIVANGDRSGIYHLLDSLLQRYHSEDFTSPADAQYTN